MKKMLIVSLLMGSAVAYGLVVTNSAAPVLWISGYDASVTNGYVSIPASTLTSNGASASDTNNVSGDVRELTKAMLEELYASQTELAASTNHIIGGVTNVNGVSLNYMSISKRQTLNTSGQLTTSFTITYQSDVNTSSITDE